MSLKNQEDANTYQQLIQLLINHCGETGQNEGAVETLQRILKDADRWNSIDHSTIIINTEIVELVKKRLEECETNSNKISAKDDWVEYKFQIRLVPELKKMLGVYDEKTMGSLPHPNVAKGENDET